MRTTSLDRIRGFAEVPFTLNHYGYCWNNPGIYVDLDGLWPKWVESTVKVVTVVATVVAVGAVVVGTGGTAAVLIAGALTAGTVGGFANEKSGGSYTNGFIGGAATGTIQGVASLAGPLGNVAGATFGSGIGTAITDGLDNKDSTVTHKHQDVIGDVIHSTEVGFVWGVFAGAVQGIIMSNDAMLKSDPKWFDFNGYTITTGNVLNTFYGAVTVFLANRKAFEKEMEDEGKK